MDKLELTFPIFYHCAIKGACSLQQYNCVNVLLNGEPKSDSGISISESTASVYVNGAKPLPKDMIFDILHRPTAEIVRRLRELNFFDVTAIADSMERLLELVDVSAAAKNELLNMRRGEDPEYRFLSEVFRSALKNSPSTKRLTVEEKALIHACRSSAQGDDVRRPLQNDFPQRPGRIEVESDLPQAETPPSDPGSSSARQPLRYEKDRRELLRVYKYTAETPLQQRDLLDFCIDKFAERESFINVDQADITAVLPHGCEEYAVSLECRGAVDEIKRYITHSSHFSEAISILIYIVGPSSVGICDVSELTSVVQDKCADEVNIIFGVDFDDSLAEGDFCVYLIASLCRKEEPANKTEDSERSGPSKKDGTAAAEAPAEDITDEADQFPLNLFKD